MNNKVWANAHTTKISTYIAILFYSLSRFTSLNNSESVEHDACCCITQSMRSNKRRLQSYLSTSYKVTLYDYGGCHLNVNKLKFKVGRLTC